MFALAKVSRGGEEECEAEEGRVERSWRMESAKPRRSAAASSPRASSSVVAGAEAEGALEGSERSGRSGAFFLVGGAVGEARSATTPNSISPAAPSVGTSSLALRFERAARAGLLPLAPTSSGSACSESPFFDSVSETNFEGDSEDMANSSSGRCGVKSREEGCENQSESRRVGVGGVEGRKSANEARGGWPRAGERGEIARSRVTKLENARICGRRRRAGAVVPCGRRSSGRHTRKQGDEQQQRALVWALGAWRSAAQSCSSCRR